jgi:hypothetical protein
LALRLGRRTSVDFDFVSNAPFDPERIAASVPFLKDAERIQVGQDTRTCRVDRGGPVLVSFSGGVSLGQVTARDQLQGVTLFIASQLDIAGTTMAVVQKRGEAKDYLDTDALLKHGVDLSTALAGASSIAAASIRSSRSRR